MECFVGLDVSVKTTSVCVMVADGTIIREGKAVCGPGRFDWGDFVVEQPGGIAFFGNDIVGAGGLVKRGAGELVLTGNSSYVGATRIESGFLSVMGSIASPTSVSGSGVLAGNRDITLPRGERLRMACRMDAGRQRPSSAR